MSLELPAQLTEPERRAWIERLAAEWRRPQHGSLGVVAVMGLLRGRLLAWAAAQPWPTYTAAACFDLLEDYCERHLYAEQLFRGVSREQFKVPDATQWSALKWDLVLATAPVAFLEAGLKLDVLWPAATNELLRRLEGEQPGAWGMIVAMTLFAMPPSTRAGRQYAEQIFPAWGARLDALATEGRQRLRRMVWKHMRKRLRQRLERENGFLVVETALWEAARDFCAGRSIRELVLAALHGELRRFAIRAAARVRDDDRRQYGAGVLTMDDFVEPKRQHVTEVTVRLSSAEIAVEWNEVGALDARIDLQRADQHVQEVGRRDPTVRLGWEVFLARYDGVAWEQLETKYEAHRTTLTRWVRAALRVAWEKL